MNVKHTKKPETRVDVKYLSSLGIKTYGDNNLYPQTVRDIVDSSPTGRTCVERRSTYIEGNGLASQALAETVCDTRQMQKRAAEQLSGDRYFRKHSSFKELSGCHSGTVKSSNIL